MIAVAFETSYSLLLSRSYFLGISNFVSQSLRECAIGLPLELRQTVGDTRRAAFAKRESANVFTQPNSALGPPPVARLRASQDRRSWQLASSSTLAVSWCELRWWLRGATFEVCNSESFWMRRSTSLGDLASRAMSFGAVEVGAAIAAGEANEQPPRPTSRRWCRFSS
jgi:hypothetical protein